ncbi:rhodanese-like domain-containing protein [Janibacter alittae]|uniref:Rhodanese-like domain-containing protein n=1 Tax=Janibacter alittae TaxID=3115209 RepID=A0ABZ2MGY0_9MICO
MTTDTATRPATLDVAQLRDWMDGPTGRIIDVRTPGEFADVHIPGSYNVPLDLLEEHRRELVEHLDDHVVLVCRSGGRACRAEGALATAGLPNLHILDGGITAWESAGGDVVRGDGTWDLERQVRLVAGSIVLTGVLASTVVPQAKWISAGIGAGLTGAALTDTCAMGMLLSKLPYNRRNMPAPETVFAQLREGRR